MLFRSILFHFCCLVVKSTTVKWQSLIVQHDADYVIPPKQNTKDPWFVDWHLYKERHLVECFFNKLKQFRRVATRYDKLASSFLAFVYVAAIAILLK